MAVSLRPAVNGLTGALTHPSRVRCVSVRSVAEPVVRSTLPSPGSPVAKPWSPNSWREFPVSQQPNYPDPEATQAVLDEIASYPPIVTAGECRNLQAKLAKACVGEAFIVQGGDCAEAFSQFSANNIRDFYRLLLQMSLIVAFGGGMPVIKLGRIAGQFAKPRSADTETIDGVELPSYRGDIVNGPEFTAAARVPDPNRLVRAYNQSAATLNLLRGFSSGGYGGLSRVSKWNLDFMAKSKEGADYMDIAARVDDCLSFMSACGVDVNEPAMSQTEFYTSHECLLLGYESALTREDSTTGKYYGCSAHYLWAGERTRQLDHAHLEFMRGIHNPIGVKVSDKCSPEDLLTMIRAFNPDNVPGRLTVITRMGAKKMREHLPKLIQAVQDSGLVVCWQTDPMHGNTETVSGYKTRRYDNIRAEIEAFFDVHDQMGTVPGGIHLEMTGSNVTECIGGGSSVTPEDLESRYHTHCDPRLNAEQSLELAFFVASRLRTHKALLASRNSPVKACVHAAGVAGPPPGWLQSCCTMPSVASPPCRYNITDTKEERQMCVSAELPPSMARPVWTSKDFRVHKELYRGFASIIYQAVDKVSGSGVILKLYRKSKLTAVTREQVERELQIHIRLNHENIIKLFAAYEDGDHVYMVLEHARAGDLYGELESSKAMRSERECCQFVVIPMLRVLTYLRTQGIIHRDIKPENIFLSADKTLKLADFGLAIDEGIERPVTRAGTLDFMAPEVLLCPEKTYVGEHKEQTRLSYGHKVDCWALGALTYEVLVGVAPFENASAAKTREHIVSRRVAFPSHLSSGVRDFISCAMVKNPENRMSIEQLCAHSWVRIQQRSSGCGKPLAAAPPAASVTGKAAVRNTLRASLLTTLSHSASARKPSNEAADAGAAPAPGTPTKSSQLAGRDADQGAAAAAAPLASSPIGTARSGLAVPSPPLDGAPSPHRSSAMTASQRLQASAASKALAAAMAGTCSGTLSGSTDSVTSSGGSSAMDAGAADRRAPSNCAAAAEAGSPFELHAAHSPPFIKPASPFPSPSRGCTPLAGSSSGSAGAALQQAGNYSNCGGIGATGAHGYGRNSSSGGGRSGSGGGGYAVCSDSGDERDSVSSGVSVRTAAFAPSASYVRSASMYGGMQGGSGGGACGGGASGAVAVPTTHAHRAARAADAHIDRAASSYMPHLTPTHSTSMSGTSMFEAASPPGPMHGRMLHRSNGAAHSESGWGPPSKLPPPHIPSSPCKALAPRGISAISAGDAASLSRSGSFTRAPGAAVVRFADADGSPSGAPGYGAAPGSPHLSDRSYFSPSGSSVASSVFDAVMPNGPLLTGEPRARSTSEMGMSGSGGP
ncbi:hypothetical protein FOA52_002956 [Chlamydomonas sp. UWO 241]|nr:hypothetical protein FOA52_002956 [Chlamydomonas sp. UWO 241]